MDHELTDLEKAALKVVEDAHHLELAGEHFYRVRARDLLALADTVEASIHGKST